MEEQKANLYEVIHADRIGPAPLALRTVVTESPGYMMGGPVQAQRKAEVYIRLSALPEELRNRVELAVQALLSGP